MRKLVLFLVNQLDRVAPPRVSAVVVVILLLALTIALLNGIVIRFAMSTLNNTFESVNNEEDPDFAAPTTPLRSGGPGSLVAWSTLGHQGRVFIAGGPSVDTLTKFNGAQAIEPIRALRRAELRQGFQGDRRTRRPGVAAHRRS